MEIQTRDRSGALKFFEDPKEAFDYARDNKEVWKISFGGVRLVRVLTRIIDDDGANTEHAWFYQPMQEIVDEILKEGPTTVS